MPSPRKQQIYCINVVLRRDTFAKLENIADQRNQSLTHLLGDLLEKAVAELEEQAGNSATTRKDPDVSEICDTCGKRV